MKKALILVDIQNDFCSNGSLAVPHAEDILDTCQKLMTNNSYDLIVATLDWHPANHSSFIKNSAQGIWPEHCVQNTFGSELHSSIVENQNLINKIVFKGTNPEIDSYSGFFDNDKKSATDLHKFLQENGITDIDVVGLALDYCVKATAIDGHNLGYKTKVILSATRAVNINPQDGEKAIAELKNEGIYVE